MTRTHRFFTVVAALHLVLVAGGAFKKPFLPRKLPAAGALRIYGAISGSDSNYGFFAPSVGPTLRAVFVLTDGNKSWTATAIDGLNAEAGLRAGCPASVFGMPESSEETRQGLVASWAANALSRHPAATAVTIRVEVFDPPSMAEFAEGKTAEWKMVEEFGPFTRNQTSPETFSK
jgi:hypothetical protein